MPYGVVKIGVFVTPVQDILLHDALGILTVTVLLPEVKPEFALKRTISLAEGKDVLSAAPPEVDAQCVKSFQLPVPPTQK